MVIMLRGTRHRPEPLIVQQDGETQLITLTQLDHRMVCSHFRMLQDPLSLPFSLSPPSETPFPDKCLICKEWPVNTEPVCELCLQNAGMILFSNADLFGASADLQQQGWALLDAVRTFIAPIPHGELPPRLVHTLSTFEASLRRANGD